MSPAPDSLVPPKYFATPPTETPHPISMSTPPDYSNLTPANILLVDDDPEDRMLSRLALKKHQLINHVNEVANGEELLQYLSREGEFSDPTQHPMPDLILLDINMPRMTGLEALAEIRKKPHLKSLPVVILTTSNADKDIVESYDLGVNSYITKPVTFKGFTTALTQMSDYWFALVKRPAANKR